MAAIASARLSLRCTCSNIRRLPASPPSTCALQCVIHSKFYLFIHVTVTLLVSETIRFTLTQENCPHFVHSSSSNALKCPLARLVEMERLDVEEERKKGRGGKSIG